MNLYLHFPYPSRRILHVFVLNGNDVADFGKEQPVFFPSLFLAKGNSTKRSFIPNCPGAVVDYGTCYFFLSLNSQVDFSFFPSLFVFFVFFLNLLLKKNRERFLHKWKETGKEDGQCCFRGWWVICGCLLRHEGGQLPPRPSAPPSGWYFSPLLFLSTRSIKCFYWHHFSLVSMPHPPPTLS